MNVIKSKSIMLASQMFPNEKWYPFGNNCFVSKRRIQEGLHSKVKKSTLKEEIATAKIIAQNNYTIFLISEAKTHLYDNSKKPDAIMEGTFAEIKGIHGSEDKAAVNFFDAIEKANIAILRIYNGMSVKRVKEKIYGKLLVKMKKTSNEHLCQKIKHAFVIDSKDQLHKIDIHSIYIKAKSNNKKNTRQQA